MRLFGNLFEKKTPKANSNSLEDSLSRKKTGKTIATGTVIGLGLATTTGIPHAQDRPPLPNSANTPPTGESVQKRPDDAINYFKKRGLISGKVSETINSAIQEAIRKQSEEADKKTLRRAQTISESFGEISSSEPDSNISPAGYKTEYAPDGNFSFVLKAGEDYKKEGTAVDKRHLQKEHSGNDKQETLKSTNRIPTLEDNPKIPFINPGKVKTPFATPLSSYPPEKNELEAPNPNPEDMSTINELPPNAPQSADIHSGESLNVGKETNWDNLAPQAPQVPQGFNLTPHPTKPEKDEQKKQKKVPKEKDRKTPPKKNIRKTLPHYSPEFIADGNYNPDKIIKKLKESRDLLTPKNIATLLAIVAGAMNSQVASAQNHIPTKFNLKQSAKENTIRHQQLFNRLKREWALEQLSGSPKESWNTFLNRKGIKKPETKKFSLSFGQQLNPSSLLHNNQHNHQLHKQKSNKPFRLKKGSQHQTPTRIFGNPHDDALNKLPVTTINPNNIQSNSNIIPNNQRYQYQFNSTNAYDDKDSRPNVYIDKNSEVYPNQVEADPSSEISIGGMHY